MEATQQREPWNKGKLVGQKPPLKPKDIWAIRIHLQNERHVRDLAMFNLAGERIHASPITVTTIERECGALRCSYRYTPCQVPSARRPPLTGNVWLLAVTTVRAWAAMSSGPSVSWR